MKKLFLLLGSVVLFTLVTSLQLTSAQATFKIGALTKNEDNPFFVRMIEGYRFAAERYDVEIVIGSTPTEDSAEEQLAILEGWLEEGDFDGFIVTPFRSDSLNSALAEATEAGIPIINVDELIPADIIEEEGLSIATKIASNNVRAGNLAGLYAVDNLSEGSEVAIVEGAMGTSSSIDRVSGFINTAETGGLRVVASQPANWDRDTAFDVATDILERYPEVKAIFAANDVMGQGVIDAIAEADLSDDVFVLSVDAVPEALEAVDEERLAGTVAQFPDEMAVLAVEAMLKVLQGRPIAPEIESPVALITEDNLNDSESQLGDAKIAPLRIGALTKNEDNPFFVRMIEGYLSAAESYDIEIVIGSTPTEDSAEEQLAILEGWLEEGDFDGFIVTPFRSDSLNSALAEATEAGIPIINTDELIPADIIDEDNLLIATQIASNNVRAGSLAGLYAVENLPEGSEVAVIEGAPGTSSSIDRVSGFISTAEGGGLRVVASQPADWDRDIAFEVARDILERRPNIKAIFAANDVMGQGVIDAIAEADLSDDVIVLSVDAVPEALEAVDDELLAGTVAQFPDEMAVLAVENIIKVIENRPIPPFVESPVVLITIDNLP